MSRLVSVCLVVCLVPTSPAQYRVVVQEMHGREHTLQATADGKLAWIVGGVNEHMLQVIDPNAGVVLRTFYFPDRIESVSMDSGTGKVAVSTRSGIRLGQLTDDELREILPDIHGALLLDKGAQLLAVLGNVPRPRGKEPERFSLREGRTLGIYDLQERKWRYSQPTPLAAPYLTPYQSLGLPALLFHEGKLLAGGVGGTLGSMIPIIFETDVRLDLKTGQTQITTGPSTRFGETIKLPKHVKGGDPDDPAKAYEGAELKHDPKYAYPPLLTKARDSAEALSRKLQKDERLQRLQLTHPFPGAPPMPYRVEEGRVQMALRRMLRIKGDTGSKTVLVTLGKDGKVTFDPSHDSGENPLGRGSIDSLRVEEYHTELNDLFTGKALLPKGVIQSKGQKDAYFLKGVGTLVQQGDQLSLYRPGEAKPVWTRKSLPYRRIEAQMDANRKLLAFTCGEAPILAEFIRLSDGERHGVLDRPRDVIDNYMNMALSRDGNRFGIMNRSELRVFDVATGKQLESHQVLEDAYSRSLHGWSGGWVVSSEAKAQIFEDRVKKFTTRIPFAGITEMEEVDTPRGKRFVLQDYTGACCLADATTGAILSRWMASEYGRIGLPWNAVFADGKGLLRPTGWDATLEVLDLRDAQLALTIHAVPGDRELGFIVFTPDGWWDATPGAEAHVTVFEKGVRVAEKRRDERRNAKLIQERLAGLWSK